VPDFYAELLRAARAPLPPGAVPRAGAWIAGLPAELLRREPPIERAVLAAVRGSVPAHAVAAGHQAALRALVPGLPTGGAVAFCASEEGGAHPRGIRTRLAPDAQGRLRLDGRKQWATLAPAASTLLVVASTGHETGDGGDRNVLRVVRVPSGREGVSVEPMPPTGFLPELDHAVVRLSGVEVEPAEVLPGDGYLDAVRPFRTIEDLHVAAALVAFTLGVGVRAAWPEPALERQLALLAGARSLASELSAAPSASPPGTHLALAGWLAQTQAARLLDEPLWLLGDAALAAAWRRDTAREVAAAARERRRERAWERLHA
jgi:alkylation response protein AidB-like acyl-CoA dehydrogenase